MTRWCSRWKYLVLLLLLPIWGCIGCASVGMVDLMPVWTELVQGDDERRGFGAYSYVLFGSSSLADRETEQKYLATLVALARFAPSFDATEMRSPTDRVNLIHVPVMRRSQSEEPQWESTYVETMNRVLSVYDFRAASALLQNTGEGDMSRGPYLVTAWKPLSSTTAEGNVIVFLDLTNVPTEDVPLWVEQFCVQMRSEERWNDRGVRVFFLKVRAGLGTVAMIAPVVNEAAERFYKLIAPPR